MSGTAKALRLRLGKALARASVATFVGLVSVAPLDASVEKRWIGEFQRIDDLARRGDWETVHANSLTLTKKMLKRLGTGEGARYGLALVTTYRAMAELAQERVDDARWHWGVAKSL